MDATGSGSPTPAEVTGGATADSIAAAIAGSRNAWARIVFQRDVGLDQFLDGIQENIRRARDAGLIAPAGAREVIQGLPRWFSPLKERGIEEDDRLLYRVRHDTLRTVFQRRDGRVVIDQVDVGPEHRRTLLASFVAPDSDFRQGLLEDLEEKVSRPDVP